MFSIGQYPWCKKFHSQLIKAFNIMSLNTELGANMHNLLRKVVQAGSNTAVVACFFEEKMGNTYCMHL